MDNGQLDIITIVIAGVATIIGAIMIAVRNKVGDKKKKQMLVIVGTAFIASAGISLFINSVEVREILVAFAAVVAAIIAAISIYQSRQMRQDSIDRESRDRKERLVNEVTEWLRDLESHIFPKHVAGTSELEDMLQRSPEISRETWFLLKDLDIASAKADSVFKGIKEAEYYQKLTSKLNEELSSSIGAITNNLEQRSQLLTESIKFPRDYSEIICKIHEGTIGEEMEKEFSLIQLITELIENDDRPLEGSGLTDKDIIGVRLGRNSGAISKSILNAVDRVIELKTSLI